MSVKTPSSLSFTQCSPFLFFSKDCSAVRSLVSWLVGWLVGWLVVIGLVSWLVGWFVGKGVWLV